MCLIWIVFFFKQKTAYEMRISDWSSDVCSSDLAGATHGGDHAQPQRQAAGRRRRRAGGGHHPRPRARQCAASGRGHARSLEQEMMKVGMGSLTIAIRKKVLVGAASAASPRSLPCDRKRVA